MISFELFKLPWTSLDFLNTHHHKPKSDSINFKVKTVHTVFTNVFTLIFIESDVIAQITQDLLRKVDPAEAILIK